MNLSVELFTSCTKPTLTSASSFRLNSKCDVTLSFTPPKRHSGYRLQFITKKNHFTLTKRMWREKLNLWRSCKKLTILLHELPVSLHTHNTEFQVLARQLTNHEQLKSNIPAR